MEQHKLFSTLFFNIEDVHLIKDPGMIPYTMHNSYGYDCIVPLWANKVYKNKNKLFFDVNTPILKWDNKEGKRRKTTIKWLKKNAKKINILHLYFFNLWTAIYIFIYKKSNHKGLVYVHLDDDGTETLRFLNNKKKWKKFILKKFIYTSKNCKDILWGIQNKDSLAKAKGKWPFVNMLYVPNGFHWNKENPYIPFEKRYNVVLTVARNGTEQKQTNILMNGFAAIADEFPDWKLILAGTVEESFKPFIEQYFQNHSNLKKRVIFLGPIENRDELQKLYATSKIFALPSAWESFGLVTIEALSEGCYVIESDIAANIDITENGCYGRLFKSLDEKDFTDKLQYSLRHPEEMSKVSKSGYDYVNENYKWQEVLKPVDKWLKQRCVKK